MSITGSLRKIRSEKGNFHESQKPPSIGYELRSFRMGVVVHKKDNAFEMVTPYSETHRTPKDSIYKHMREIPSFELDGFMEKHTVYDSTEWIEGTIGSVEPFTITSYTRIKKTDELTQIDYQEWQVESAGFRLKIKNNPDRPADMELRVKLNGYYSSRRLDPSDGRESIISKKTSDAYIELIFVSE